MRYRPKLQRVTAFVAVGILGVLLIVAPKRAAALNYNVSHGVSTGAWVSFLMTLGADGNARAGVRSTSFSDDYLTIDFSFSDCASGSIGLIEKSKKYAASATNFVAGVSARVDMNPIHNGLLGLEGSKGDNTLFGAFYFPIKGETHELMLQIEGGQKLRLKIEGGSGGTVYLDFPLWGSKAAINRAIRLCHLHQSDSKFFPSPKKSPNSGDGTDKHLPIKHD